MPKDKKAKRVGSITLYNYDKDTDGEELLAPKELEEISREGVVLAFISLGDHATGAPNDNYFSPEHVYAYIKFCNDHNLPLRIGLMDHPQVWNLLKGHFAENANIAIGHARSLYLKSSRTQTWESYINDRRYHFK